MNENKLSTYADEKFVKFLKNKNIQNTINDMIVWLNVVSDDDILQIYLTMFLSTVEVDKLAKHDLELLKQQIAEIRAAKITYPIVQQDSIPTLTRAFIKDKILEKAII